MKYTLALLTTAGIFCAEKQAHTPTKPMPIPRLSLDSQRDVHQGNSHQSFVPEAQPFYTSPPTLEQQRSISESHLRSASATSVSPPGLSKFPGGVPPRPPRQRNLKTGSISCESLPSIPAHTSKPILKERKDSAPVSSSVPKDSSVPTKRGHRRNRSRSETDVRRIMAQQAASPTVTWAHTGKPRAPLTPHERNLLRKQRHGSKAFAQHRKMSIGSPPSGFTIESPVSSSSSFSSSSISTASKSPKDAHAIMASIYDLCSEAHTPEHDALSTEEQWQNARSRAFGSRRFSLPQGVDKKHLLFLLELNEREALAKKRERRAETSLLAAQKTQEEIMNAVGNLFYMLNQFESEQFPLLFHAIQAHDESVKQLKKSEEWIRYHKERFAHITQTQAQNTAAIERLLLAQAAACEKELEGETAKKERRGLSVSSFLGQLSPRSSKDSIERKGSSAHLPSSSSSSKKE